MMASAEPMNMVVHAEKQEIPVASVFENFGGDVGKGAGEGGELLVRGMEAFCAVEDEHRSEERTGDVHAKVDDNVAAGIL